MGRQRVFVTGIGLISSIGNDVSSVLRSLRNLSHGFAPFIPQNEKLQGEVKLAGTVKDFDLSSSDFEDWQFPSRYRIRRDKLRSLPPHGVYAYAALEQAIESARLQEDDISNLDTGMYTASGGSMRLVHNNMSRMHQLGPMRCPPTGIVSSIAGTLSFNLVAAFKIRGNSCGFSSACASSGHALGYAFDDIALGRQKRMFVVAGEDLNDESVLPFAGMRALSLKDDPGRASCPFDKERNGFVSTGGGAVLVLESEQEATRRGVAPFAELLGWGQASDGHNVAMSHPEGLGLIEAMRRALESSGLEAGEVDYVNAHATSTVIGDLSEGKALTEVFGKRGYRPKVSSTKALTGHGLSLASALEASFVALSMKEGITPGSAHLKELDPVFGDLNVIRETEAVAPAVALSNSSGFGGANVTLAFRKV
ncbi:beta-ketoacyl-[acyl-carrier-protein] synthase family protein [Pelagicoccus sp. SDUM812003]|uniref:beta-ketoacyl-[acyl-carrier-protein] synthase family protein n=1 Tax=Pelagicoccus sp. SDUM812003 TaxID=3041267 RepID=UPI0028106EA3|nr:beta-ketoacyl-[acyl-carrier-protein] synthase family protein [Pelagicoccus sp. SDUM812003]MDQ8205555.1 beta-ketoacyl-[acyl-carrier-protein] synthase family protein [Pelagicoccus sp. SDUM812003]